MKLQNAAANGPVVILNITEDGCTTLAVTPCGVVHILLPTVSLQVAETLVKLVWFAGQRGSGRDSAIKDSPVLPVDCLIRQVQTHLDTSNRADSEPRHGRRVTHNCKDPNVVFQFALATLWTEVVKPILDSLDLKVTSLAQRISGLMS